MKKYKIIGSLLLCLFMLFMLMSCAGMSDWRYDDLPGYEVWRVNSEQIFLGRANDEYDLVMGPVVVPSYVYAVSSTDDYVFAQRIESKDADPKHPEYYVVPVGSDKAVGPFDASGFKEYCADNDIAEPTEWLDIYYLSRHSR